MARHRRPPFGALALGGRRLRYIDLRRQSLPSADWLAGIGRKVVEEFLGRGTERLYRSGDWLMAQGDPADRVLLVKQGLVALSVHPGRFMTFRGPHSLIGEYSVLNDCPRLTTVQAVNGYLVPELVVVEYSGATFRGLLANGPALAAAVRASLARKREEEVDRITRYHDGPGRQRVAQVLVDHVQIYGRTMGGGDVVIAAPLTRERISQLVGLTPSAVRDVLADLERKGVLSRRSDQVRANGETTKRHNHIQIRDRQGLAEACQRRTQVGSS